METLADTESRINSIEHVFFICVVFLFPRGLFITIHDRSHISTLLQSWPEKDIRVSTAHLDLHCLVLLHNVPELSLSDIN